MEASTYPYSVYIKEGIIFCVYHKSDLIVDIEVMKNVIKRRIEIADGKSYPILIDARDVKYWTLEARKYGLSNEAHKNAIAYATLLNSSIARTIVNWALKIFPVPMPNKLFNNDEEALRWLKQFVDMDEKPSRPLLVF